MNKKQDVRPRTFGLSLLLVVLLVLSLLTFAAISITEARNDLHGARKKLTGITAYNAAEDEAEMALLTYTAQAMSDPAGAEETLDFSVSIDERNDLHVEASLLWDETGETCRYHITRWQVEADLRLSYEHTPDVLPDGKIGW